MRIIFFSQNLSLYKIKKKKKTKGEKNGSERTFLF